jgi:hypothetical protein
MAKKNKIIELIDGDGSIMVINTKRLDAVYLNGKRIYFSFSKRSVNSGEFCTPNKADKVRSKFIKEWLGE